MSRKHRRNKQSPIPGEPTKVQAMDVFRAQAKEGAKVGDKAALAARTSDGFDSFIANVGLRTSNPLAASAYTFDLITRNRVQLEAAFRGSWIVGKMVNSVAEDMTRAGVDITSNEANNDIKDLQSNISKLQIWQSLKSLVAWGRLYGGAIGVMQIEGQDLATPLNLDSITKDQFKGLAIYDRWQLNPVLNELIQSGPDMGLPAIYQIVNDLRSMSGSVATTPTGQQPVHHSRIFRYTGIDLPYFQAITEMMWGESILEQTWDRLIAFDNATMSAGQLIDRASLRMVGIDGYREIIGAGGQAQEGLEKQFEAMRLAQVNEGLTILDKEDVYSSTAYSFAGLPETILQMGQQLSGASGIPLVILFGQSPAGLSSTGESDVRMYYDSINAQQNAKLRRPMDTLIRVLWRSTYGVPEPKDLEFTFQPLWQMSATDKANNAKTIAETIIGAYDAQLIPKEKAMEELRQTSDETGLFGNISDEDIADAKSKADEPPLPGESMPSLTSPIQKADPKAAQTQPEPPKVETPEPVKNLDAAPRSGWPLTDFGSAKTKTTDAKTKSNVWEKIKRWAFGH